jgi:PKD repeat protein
MKNLALFLFTFFAASFLHAQQLVKPSQAEIVTLPAWAPEMYSEDPNVIKVDSLYTSWYSTHPFVKTYHTQYYMFWRRKNSNWIDENGFIRKPLATAFRIAGPQSSSMAPWTLVGPEKVWGENGSRRGEQTNVYSITQCTSSPNVLYCGTEPGEVYRSLDAGLNWTLVTPNDPLDGGVTAVCVDPNDSAKVFVGSGDLLMVSNDAGATWNISYAASGLGVNEILVHPMNSNCVMIAAQKGFYKSNDGGQTWTQIYSQTCWDVKMRPNTPNFVYLLKTNPAQQMCEFYLSSDTGSSFTIQTAGWYSSTNSARFDGGARLAVSPADPLRVYAYLIGDSKPNDYGYIGLYRSNNGGVNWTLPNGPDGGPYTASHLNLAYGQPSWTYNQGYYNCAIMADPNDADNLLIGGLNLYRSNNGASSFTSVAGYVGGPLDIHVDMQDFRVGPNGVWVTNDGGIYYSTDFFTNDNQVRMDGVHGSEFWGFGTGWNEDVMVGGLYHNGNIAYYENYADGDFLELGGAEPASGYVNPGDNRQVYSSELGGVYLPTAIGLPLQWSSIGMWPNESYYATESSEMKFDPTCYSIAWIGNENKLYKSTDGGGSYNLVHAFGSNVNAKLSYFEICASNTKVMYVVQRPASGNIGFLWKTIDGGTNWTQLTIPVGTSKRMLVSTSPSDEDSLWISYPAGANGSKVFQSGNGGATWTNLSSSLLDNQEGRSLMCVGATNGGVYYVTNTTVYYRNNTMSNWVVDNTGLPVYMNSLYARPFYKEGKIRVSTYGRGVWENSFIDQPTHPVAHPQVDKLSYTINCDPDTFHFEDHSVLNHTGASWAWSFPGGNPSSSTIRNPDIVYTIPGTYIVTLTVTDAASQTDSDTLAITVNAYQQNTNLTEGFQNAFPPTGWFDANLDNGPQWSLATNCGGYGTSSQSMIFDNYDYDSHGTWDDQRIRVDMTQQPADMLFFDYAYAEYGFPYSDSLEVLVSLDCGATFTSLWRKGGSQLATAPSNQSAAFVPAASEWLTDSIDLSAYNTQTDLLIAFRNHGHWGQAMYVDNINIGTPLSVQNPLSQTSAVFLTPTAISSSDHFTLYSTTSEAFIVEITDQQGQLVHRGNYSNGQAIETENLAAGIYYWRAISDSMIRTGKVIVAARRQ